MVRNFTTTTVGLVNVKFEDSGTYFYTAEYRGCGFEAAKLFQGEGFVQVNFHAAFPYYMHGKVLDVNGYQMAFEIEKVIEKWLNEFTVYVYNDFGKHDFKFVLEERKLKLNTFDIESFINMNTAAVFGLSGGVVLFVVITSGVVICCIRKLDIHNSTKYNHPTKKQTPTNTGRVCSVCPLRVCQDGPRNDFKQTQSEHEKQTPISEEDN
uniref:Uncharacterized protein n=1 Tax=Magallana gigas TaxID=29159 RepID=K1RLG6_MAGGI